MDYTPYSVTAKNTSTDPDKERRRKKLKKEGGPTEAKMTILCTSITEGVNATNHARWLTAHHR
jgi:hypothetical protein